jgi:hypothetical protein
MLVFWLPLAASWLLMSAETPILQAAIARLPEMQTQLAAFGIVMSLQITIESPVIMLLATSTALSTSARNYLTLRRFMLGLNILCTVAALLMAYGPLFDAVVGGWMGVPSDIVEAALPGMRIMVLWSAAIGVRRFLQGVLIRHSQTRWIGYGTIVRLLSSGGTGIALALLTPLPGVWVGSIGLMAGVCSEAVFAMVVSRPTLRRIVTDSSTDPTDGVSMRDVIRYHSPLAATALLMLMAQPVIGAGLARMSDPRENLAAWPVTWAILFMFRSPAFALPETVIAFISQGRSSHVILAFCRRVGLASSAAMGLLALSPLSGVYFRHVAGLPKDLARFVLVGLIIAVPLPFISAFHSWLRGLLLTARQTGIIYWGMGINLGLMTLLMIIGVLIQGPGAPTAMVALTLAFLAEIAYLRKYSGRLPAQPR